MTKKRLPARPDPRGKRTPPPPPTLAEVWRTQSWPVRVLRVFLGVTFVFAGAQKLLDPNFLRPQSPSYIGAQLAGFAKGTPLGWLMQGLGRAPTVVGVGVALTEIAVGLGTLLGIAAIAAAAVGLAINVTLWLTATWHVHPYFLGSDSIYAVAWLALLVGLWEIRLERRPAPSLAATIDGIGRREMVRAGAVGGLSVAIAFAAKALAGPAAKTGIAMGPGIGGGTSTPTAAPSQGTTSSPTGAPSSAKGTVLTTLSALPVGKAIGFTAPGVGAAVLLRLANDSVVAYSRICTHAGCLVGYDPSSKILFCPCHGAE